MLWLSTTTCTPKPSPEEGSAPVVVRFALRWVPSLEKQENCNKILRLFTKKIHVVAPKLRPQKLAPLKLNMASAHGYTMSAEPPP